MQSSLTQVSHLLQTVMADEELRRLLHVGARCGTAGKMVEFTRRLTFHTGSKVPTVVAFLIHSIHH